jgi:hypothetical protein
MNSCANLGNCPAASIISEPRPYQGDSGLRELAFVGEYSVLEPFRHSA